MSSGGRCDDAATARLTIHLPAERPSVQPAPLRSLGWLSDRFGRRWPIIIPALIALPLAPLYLRSADFLWIAVGFVAQGMCAGGGMQGQMVPYLNERFPTEIRATASAFCYHQAAIFGGFVPLVLTYLAEHFGTGLAR